MARGTGHIKARILTPDTKYNNGMVSQFINYVMLSGKKTVATRAVYGAFDILSDRLKQDPLVIFEAALKNTAPILEVKGRRIGGANYQIPMEVPRARRQTLAMKWIITAARASQGKPIEQFLADEIENAYKNTGSAIKKKEDMHRMAEANKAFAHFARFS